QYPQYKHAIGLQLKDSLLKCLLLSDLLVYDSLCNKGKVTKNDYDSRGMKLKYEYPDLLKNAFIKQINKNDTGFLNLAGNEFELWGRFVWEFYNTVAKPGFHQLSIGKTEFE